MTISPTLSLTARTHLFIKDGKVFFKLHKVSQFSDKKDYSVVNAITLEQAEKAYAWLGQVIAQHKQNQEVIHGTTITPSKPSHY